MGAGQAMRGDSKLAMEELMNRREGLPHERKFRPARNERRARTSAYKMILHYARMSGRLLE